jgi:subfamily B ATP-binding cassette protein MsbA
VQRAHQSLDLLFSDVIQSALALVVGIGTLLFISWQLTLTLAVAAPLMVGVIAGFGRRIRRNAARRQETQGDVTQRLIQILSGIKVIKAFQAEGGEQGRFERENRRLFQRNLKVVKYRALSRGVIEAVTNVVGMLVMLGGVAIVLGRLWGLTLGELMAFVVVMQTATYRPVKELTKGWTRIQEAIPSAQRFFDLLDARPETADPPDALRISGIGRGLRISKVSFSYGREPVLQDVSLDVAAGEVVAIVGRTGSGKTTLADLLLRFYDPDSGSIEVDGVDLRRIARESWLRQVAVVTQEPFLFAGTIADNIRYGRPEASEAEVLAAARAAHVDEFAERLLHGYDTDVGEAGVLLSGGQRQRITIARAILREPTVLIFDEATSSLDAKSERLVQEAIDSLLGGRTVFIIAHRLSTVRHADKILVLDGGRVAELGTHDELMARGGIYRELMSLQAGKSGA